MDESPTYQQYLAIKYQYPGNLLLFRLGDFYEAFDQDAHEIAKLLDLQLMTKISGKAKHPMVGFPVAAAPEQIEKLIAAGWHVAIAEPVQDKPPAETKRVVTQESLFGED